MSHSSRRFTLLPVALLAMLSVAPPAPAETPEGTIAALLLQVNSGVNGENAGAVVGDGFDCNLSASNHAFDGDFPESGPCLRFFREERTITLTAVPRAGYVFNGWSRQCVAGGANAVFTLTTAEIPFSAGSSGTVPNCIAQFSPSECFEWPGGGDDEDLTTGIAPAQVEECPADDPDAADCPEGGIAGDDNDNVLDGTPGPDVICGLGGNDTIRGMGGDDLIYGGGGDDVIEAGPGNDVVMGDSGDDALHGEDGDDVLLGGTGTDLLNGDMGDDVLTGGAGRDLLIGRGGHDQLFGGDGADDLFGGPGDDQIDGQMGHDAIFGCGGSDRLEGGAGNDNLYGDLDDASSFCTWDAGEPDAGNASAARDVLIGGRGNDRLLGNGGNDTLRGLEGDDTLDGGAGNDILRGGANNDIFIANDGNTDSLHGGDGCDMCGPGLFDLGVDVLLSIEESDGDLCPPGLP